MSTRTPEIDLSDELAAEFGGNASYVAELLSRYRANPSSVDDEWRNYFRQRFGEQEPAPAAPAPAAAPASPATPLGPAVEGERATLRGGALRIAENMEASLGVPTATTQRQVPIKLADENRRLINEHRAALEQSKVSFTHLVSWAVIQALKSFPSMNDAYDGSSGEPARVRRAGGPVRPRRRRAEGGRLADAARAEREGRRADDLRRVRRRGRRRRHARAHRQDQGLRLRGHHDLADESRARSGRRRRCRA